MSVPPPEIVPPKVLEAALDFVRAVNESGERCVGVVMVVIFESTERVLPIIDKNVIHADEDDPVCALMNQSQKAIGAALVRKRAEPTGEKN